MEKEGGSEGGREGIERERERQRRGMGSDYWTLKK